MLLKACCIHVHVINCKHLCLWLAMDNFCGIFPEILYNVSGNSVEMNSVTSLTRLVFPAFCMRLITRVGGT